MINMSHCREKTESWIGRRRTYHCRECNKTFQVDIRKPLPEKDRVCEYCRTHTSLFTFIDKQTGKERIIRASDGELATLRAWDINPLLTIKIPQSEQDARRNKENGQQIA